MVDVSVTWSVDRQWINEITLLFYWKGSVGASISSACNKGGATGGQFCPLASPGGLKRRQKGSAWGLCGLAAGWQRKPMAVRGWQSRQVPAQSRGVEDFGLVSQHLASMCQHMALKCWRTDSARGRAGLLRGRAGFMWGRAGLMRGRAGLMRGHTGFKQWHTGFMQWRMASRCWRSALMQWHTASDRWCAALDFAFF